MTNKEIMDFLLWSAGINYAVLLVWFGAFTYGHDWMCRLHSRWFTLSVETFDAIHYALLGVYKVNVILFNLVPWAALYFASR